MKTIKNLYNDIISVQNLYNALRETSKSKGSKYECLKFLEWENANINQLHQDLKTGEYSLGEYIHFTILDPKPRNIVALQFRDRVVQRAIYNYIQPIFEKTFLPNSYACRKEKGTHRASKMAQSYSRKKQNKFYLKTDFSKYFLSVNRTVLWKYIERKIGCQRTLDLIEMFIPRTGTGINIGELLSQLFANVYGNVVDMFLKHELKIKHFIRYMDDIVIFGSNYKDLRDIMIKLREFASDELYLKFSKWHISHVNKGINFVGYRIFPSFKLLRKDSIKRAKRKIKKYIMSEDYNSLRSFLSSWSGHLTHADTYNLKRYIEERYGLLF